MPRLPPELASGKTPNSKSAISALGQSDNIAVVDEIGKGKWTTLYEYQCREGYSRCFYSALLSIERVSSSLEQSSWDISIGDGAPGFSQYFEDGRTITTYHRHSLPGIEPIIYSRNFHDLKPRQFDLSEEFRLFHNLYHDRNNDRFIHLDNRGNEFVAVEVAPGRVRVLTRLLQQYLAARQCALALFFDHRVDANVDAATARTTFPAVEVATADRRYSFHVGEVTNGVISRLIGKKIMPPPSITEAGIWPYETTRDDKYAEFIIGISDDGTPAVHNCNPAGLANYFGANEHAPHYLTPVWFSRDVLTKYYDDPDKFSVEDGYLRCGALWGIRIDNNLPDHVVVYLGDLGRDLSYDEQMYWKYFNISPGEGGTSVTNFKRSFLAQFSDPSSPDLGPVINWGIPARGDA